jgi:Copper type II ascorbate-dependent monooxygenase, C-terminal domain
VFVFIVGYSTGTGAAGGSRLVMPPEAGILLTNQNKFLIMETHYDNADLVTDSVDESGVTMCYADKLRPNDAGVLNTGDPAVSLFGTPVVSGKNYTFTCPSECTEMFKEPVNVFAGFLHMHLTGQKIYENKFSKNGSVIEQISAVGLTRYSYTYILTSLLSTVTDISHLPRICLTFCEFFPGQLLEQQFPGLTVFQSPKED